MGYDLHITRRSYWAGDEDDVPANGLTLNDWLTYARKDPSLRVVESGAAEISLSDGSKLRIKSSGLMAWIVPGRDPEIERGWFHYRDGRVGVKNPDNAMIRKMWAIAQALGARVQGDEGESYAADSEMIRG